MQLAAASVQEPSYVSHRPRLESHREHVLLVEPDDEAATQATRSLEAHGYRVTWMRCEREALEWLALPIWARASAEIVLVDLDRSTLNASGFMSVLRAVATSVPPVVLLAAEPAPDLLKKSLSVGAAGYVRKPLMDDDLLRTVRHSLGKRDSVSRLLADHLLSTQPLMN
jgi:DNA-binding response OmpR family regulator